ncbi:MAG TPA: TIGR03089 family protein [Marmoricola sp.]|nr:TIGR03089 family protein [Marmoricola sp.]
MATMTGLVGGRLRREPGRPFVTYYDDHTGERTELSATTWSNWVAKTAGVLIEDLDLAEGDRLRIDLPPHWLSSVFLGAAWLAGIEVVRSGAANATVGSSDADLICSLHPFALPCPAPVPTLDFGHLWPNQPDVFLGVPAAPTALAYDGTTLADLIPGPVHKRILTTLDPASPEGARLLLGALAGTGSMVLVANEDSTRRAARMVSEHIDETVD